MKDPMWKWGKTERVWTRYLFVNFLERLLWVMHWSSCSRDAFSDQTLRPVMPGDTVDVRRCQTGWVFSKVRRAECRCWDVLSVQLFQTLKASESSCVSAREGKAPRWENGGSSRCQGVLLWLLRCLCGRGTGTICSVKLFWRTTERRQRQAGKDLLIR